MDINRFEEFIVLADCLNYSKAASLLYLTQPVLSRHIHELEDLLGAQLFIRNTHRVTLTPVGELAAEELGNAMEAYHKAMRNIKLATVKTPPSPAPPQRMRSMNEPMGDNSISISPDSIFADASGLVPMWVVIILSTRPAWTSRPGP